MTANLRPAPDELMLILRKLVTDAQAEAVENKENVEMFPRALAAIRAYTARQCAEARNRGFIAGIKMGADEVGMLIKEVVKDFDTIGDRIVKSTVDALNEEKDDDHA